MPWIIRHGAEAFAALGTAKSKGTKVFALAGKVRRGGLIEVPMGVTIRQIVEEIGGGAGRAENASRRCRSAARPAAASRPSWPIRRWTTRPWPASARSWAPAAWSCSDDSDCMVDIARYFLRFTQDQSCGKCTFCRIGTRRMLEMLDRICAGQGKARRPGGAGKLARTVSAGSLCGLGKTAPNPVLSTLRYFRDEYEAHLAGRCPAGKCKELIAYRINEQLHRLHALRPACPVDAIPMTPYERHT